MRTSHGNLEFNPTRKTSTSLGGLIYKLRLSFWRNGVDILVIQVKRKLGAKIGIFGPGARDTWRHKGLPRGTYVGPFYMVNGIVCMAKCWHLESIQLPLSMQFLLDFNKRNYRRKRRVFSIWSSLSPSNRCPLSFSHFFWFSQLRHCFEGGLS